ncbi:sulfite exporter TauE/SafE family protein [Ktedonospora formicarum]|nr:sulfite exporter TauE/SafE family protein [Ktedonospora formicarum]
MRVTIKGVKIAFLVLLIAASAFAAGQQHGRSWSPGRFGHYTLDYGWLGALTGALTSATSVGVVALPPVLVLVQHVAAPVVVGVSFIVSAVIKLVGFQQLQKREQIDGKVAWSLFFGSVPATLITSLLMGGRYGSSTLIVHALGGILIVSAVFFGVKPVILRARQKEEGVQPSPSWQRLSVTVGMGALVGVVVGLASVGSSSLFMLVMLLLHPKMEPASLVGNGLVASLGVIFAGSIGTLATGTIDWNITGGLILGSLPAVFFGAWVIKKIPAKLLMAVLMSVLGLSGGLLLVK